MQLNWWMMRINKIQKGVCCYFIFLIVSFFCAEALSQEKINLKWKVDRNETLRYQFFRGSLDQHKVEFDVFDIKDSSAKVEDAIANIKKIEFPVNHMEIHMFKRENSIRAWTKNIEPEYKLPPKNDWEAQERKWLNSIAGTNGLIVDIDEKGRSLLFYLQTKDKSLVNLLYSLPENEVQVGDTWNISVQMVQAEPTLIVDKARRFSRVSLHELSLNESGQRVAGLFFLGGAYVEGQVAIKDDETRPQKAQGGYVGYGEFLIDEGRWQWLKIQSIYGHKESGYDHQLIAISLKQ